jgi:hypothetical protein
MTGPHVRQAAGGSNRQSAADYRKRTVEAWGW